MRVPLSQLTPHDLPPFVPAYVDLLIPTDEVSPGALKLNAGADDRVHSLIYNDARALTATYYCLQPVVYSLFWCENRGS